MMAMAHQRCPAISVGLVLFASLIFFSYAYQFNVGGRDGWVTNPSESYNHWAERLRFQVNDSLFFKYDKGSDSVLVVNKDDYEKCHTDKPILRKDDGNSILKFDRSGPFYFISGNKEHCEKGQKLIIVVLALRNEGKPPSVPSPSKAPSPAGHAPVASPPRVSSPNSPPPAVAPGPPAPAGKSPTSSPVPASPPAAHPPAKSPTSLPPSAAAPGSPAGSIHSPAGSPPHRSSAVSTFTPAFTLVSTVLLVISLAFGGFVHSF